MENTLIALVVALIIFLVCRELVCWYWKINEISASLKEQERAQRDMLKSLDAINENLISIVEQLTPEAEPPAGAM